jgi:integrase
MNNLEEGTMATIRKRKWQRGDEVREAWVVRYRDQSNTRHIKTFATKREAEAWSVEALHQVKIGTHTAMSASATVAQAWELWLEHCATALERSTVKQRREHLNLHVRPFIGGVKLAALTTPAIYQLDDRLRDAGRSLAMRRKVITNVGTMLAFAQGRGLVAQNVAASVKLKSEAREGAGPLREGVDYPSRAELKLLMDAVSDRWRPFLLTAIFTGMRASELRGLTWQDVDLGTGTIHVRRRANLWGELGNPKSKMGKRDIPLPPLLVNTLKAWWLACPKGAIGLVFPAGAGHVETHGHIINRFWDPLQKSCGLAGRYRFHALRHAAASLFIAHLGWPVKRVQSVLGHASASMTLDVYGHLFFDPEGDREAMRKLEVVLGGGGNV